MLTCDTFKSFCSTAPATDSFEDLSLGLLTRVCHYCTQVPGIKGSRKSDLKPFLDELLLPRILPRK